MSLKSLVFELYKNDELVCTGELSFVREKADELYQEDNSAHYYLNVVRREDLAIDNENDANNNGTAAGT